MIGQDPYILIEAQDWVAHEDRTYPNAVIVKERRPESVIDLGDHVEVGRDLCLPTAVAYSPPAYDLCAVMGKDQVCEGLTGTVRVVWCTTLPSNGAVYTSVVGPTGPWVLQATHSDYSQCHDVEFSAPAIDAMVWFYVESTTEDAQYLQSDVGVFCTGHEITLSDGNLSVSYNLFNRQKVTKQYTFDLVSSMVVRIPDKYFQPMDSGAYSTSLATVGATVQKDVSTFTMVIDTNVS
jgi:hypothetical protein